MHRTALATAVLIALALAACSTTSTESTARGDAPAQASADDAMEQQTPVEDTAPIAPIAPASPAESASAPVGTAIRATPAKAAALERIEVSGSRIRAQSEQRRMANIAPAPAPPPAPMVAYAPSPITAPPEANTENYAARDDNPVQRASEAPVSTFSIDVDTGSYANVRRMLNAGERPPADAVRAEEMINYFRYGHAAPTSLDTPFRVTTELAPAPWNARRQLMMIGIKGYDVPKATLPPANLVFLIDTSGSMDSPDKLPLLKQSFAALASQLRAQDRVSIVVYAGSAGLVLPPTPGDRRDEILQALDRLQAGGSTNGGAGIQLAYETAKQSFVAGGVNRVILATDGDFNVGTVAQGSLETYVADQRKSGIALSTLGFGTGNYNDAMAEQLADVGDGNHAYIDSVQEARKVLVDELQSTLLTIARDVKIQVEFNPAQVAEYRLVGYENRLLKREDFANDRVDAGDIGAGHEVTALYELTLVGSGAERLPALRYGESDKAATSTARGDELAHLRLRYKQPGADTSRLIETPITRAQLNATPSNAMRFAATVGAYADALRGGTHLEQWRWEDIARSARRWSDDTAQPTRAEFSALVDAARRVAGERDTATQIGVVAD